MPTYSEIQAAHVAHVATLHRAVTGAELVPDDRQDAANFVAGMALVLASDNPSIHYLLHNAVVAVRRQGGAPVAPVEAQS